MLRAGIALLAYALLAGCVSAPKGKPLLTNRALARAAAKCDVKSLGIHYTRVSKVPYGDYLVPPFEVDKGPDDRPSAECMRGALKAYLFDFLGQVEQDPGGRPKR
jgi:hypothetical protein